MFFVNIPLYIPLAIKCNEHLKKLTLEKDMKNRNPLSESRPIILMTIVLLLAGESVFTQDTVTDYDGNVYNTVTIGTQVWLKENLKSLHYSDGTQVPGVVAYNNSDSLGNIYGLLYTWNAAMKNSTTAGAQGVCPCEWHVPTDQEWTTLENYLGGTSVAGGKMKATGTEHWQSPNTGATNTSGLTMLGAGEWDGYYTPHIFQYLYTAAVLWTSTNISASKARERYMTHDNTMSGTYDWYKVMKYSIRCIRNTPAVDIQNDRSQIKSFRLNQNYPNPFNPTTTISFDLPVRAHVHINIYNMIGQEVKELLNRELPAGTHSVEWNASGMASGIYLYKISGGGYESVKKMILTK